MQGIQTSNNIDFMAIVRMHPEPILLVDENNHIVFSNTAGLKLLCRLPATHDELPPSLEVPCDAEQIVTLLDIAGHELVLDIQCQTIELQDKTVRLFYLSDVTDEIQRQRTLEKLVYTDHLTRLYNRRGIEQLAINILSSAQRHERAVMMFYIDVNGLKQINDQQGHTIGDAAIIETAHLLRNTFRDRDVIARIGGDEFIVMVTEDEEYISDHILERLHRKIKQQNLLPHRAYRLSLSIGVVKCNQPGSSRFEELLERADRQMYVAKLHGRKSQSEYTINTHSGTNTTGQYSTQQYRIA